jgi:hypothetical protein
MGVPMGIAGKPPSRQASGDKRKIIPDRVAGLKFFGKNHLFSTG